MTSHDPTNLTTGNKVLDSGSHRLSVVLQQLLLDAMEDTLSAMGERGTFADVNKHLYHSNISAMGERGYCHSNTGGTATKLASISAYILPMCLMQEA